MLLEIRRLRRKFAMEFDVESNIQEGGKLVSRISALRTVYIQHVRFM